MPRKPMISAPATKGKGGVAAPRWKARATLTEPAANPLIMAIISGSEEESFRVTLLSTPHARHAAATSSAPKSRTIPFPSHEMITAPARMAMAPKSRRRSTFSWNHSQAVAIVARPSRLRRSAAEAASVLARPSMRRSGPTRPPKKTTMANQGRSDRRSGASTPGRPMTVRPRWTAARPKPAPR